MTKEEKREYQKIYYLLNKERLLESNKLWAKNNSKCLKEYQKEYRKKNKDKIRQSNREYININRDAVKRKSSEYYQKNREVKLAYYHLNKDKKRESRRLYQINNQSTIKKYREANKEKTAKRIKEYSLRLEIKVRRNKKYIERWNNDVIFKLGKLIKGGLIKSLKKIKNKKTSRTVEYLGCGISEFKIYFEKLFTEGMTWEKYLSGEIHIDHIIPCAIFDLSKHEAQKICFHFTNLQPLWKKNNLEKRAKIDHININILSDLRKRKLLKDKYI